MTRNTLHGDYRDIIGDSPQIFEVLQQISTPENEQIVGVPLGATLEEMEEAFVRETLAWLDENRTETAKVLGIGRRTLQRKLKKYNI